MNASTVSELPPAHAAFLAEVRREVPAERIVTDPLRTLAYGTDASFYRLIPKIVVDVHDEHEVQAVLAAARHNATPVTFRAAGTSLSGQAVTDSVLVRLGSGWRGHRVLDAGERIALQPGVIGAHANRVLGAYGRKIGPDPASIDAARIGGIAANNASGMCCGTSQNSYQTLDSMRIVLADGALLDTGDETSRESFRHSHASLLNRLADLARRTRADAGLSERIGRKFSIKNTVGYSINALIDFEDPIDVLQHLMIGSEGTLGFISEIVYRSVVDHPFKSTSLVCFPDVETACAAVIRLNDEPVQAAELMDRAAIRSVEGEPAMPPSLRALPETAAALLIECRAAGAGELRESVHRVAAALREFPTEGPVRFTDDPQEAARLWNVRKGLFPAVGAVRETGTTVIIEDVTFPIARLADGTLALQRLFEKHRYHEAIIFGHAFDGNLHFVFTQDFGTDAEVRRYDRFMDDVCRMVVGDFDGSLKGEHSTGRNMAPYVEYEWGTRAYSLMREIKSIFDPDAILNPGVILNGDEKVHVKNLKPLPPADSLVDKCIECGFCEPTCPSRALTLTPRQRIVGLREIRRLERSGDDPRRLAALRKLYRYDGVDTCAGDGLCAMACPVHIDTGRMIKKMRGERAGGLARGVARTAAGAYGSACTGVRAGLGLADGVHRVLGTSMMNAVSAGIHRGTGGRAPRWNAYMPTPVRMPRAERRAGDDRRIAVYFPSCAARTMGPARGDPVRASIPRTLLELADRAAIRLVVPEAVDSLCCGMPFESKGQPALADAMARRTLEALAVCGGAADAPVFCDTSPCAYRLKSLDEESVEVQDITEFLHDTVLERLDLAPLAETVALHATCSTRKMGLAARLEAVARRCASEVIVPDDIACCGWAGDKGFTRPELNASAVASLAGQLPERCTSGYSTSRTCEIGLSLHSGRHYRSIAALVLRSAAAAGSRGEPRGADVRDAPDSASIGGSGSSPAGTSGPG